MPNIQIYRIYRCVFILTVYTCSTLVSTVYSTCLYGADEYTALEPV